MKVANITLWFCGIYFVDCREKVGTKYVPFHMFRNSKCST